MKTLGALLGVATAVTLLVIYTSNKRSTSNLNVPSGRKEPETHGEDHQAGHEVYSMWGYSHAE